MSLRLLLFFLPLFLFSACKTAKDTTPNASLRNTRWVLRTLGATPITTPENSQEIDLQFNATTDQIAGYAGCNRYFGRFEQPTNAALRLLNIGSTRMLCEARQQVETDYLKALQEVSRFQIKGDTLRLYAGTSEEPLAIFEAVYLR
ncbi:META domain-containing protein [Hymenobacter radiodurans]|uniref:META domain-containing protein n=1 Tax=Hymenobacter radiodurans TaxID=2496028 RepID=UPI001404B45F|nr:META domain-containing protein [Hymenobacter radiodurans]